MELNPSMLPNFARVNSPNACKVWFNINSPIIVPLDHTLICGTGDRVLVICVGSFATIDCEPRQARKGATVAVDSGAQGLLAQVATKPGCANLFCLYMKQWFK